MNRFTKNLTASLIAVPAAFVGCSSAPKSATNAPQLAYAGGMPGDTDGDGKTSIVEYRNHAFSAFYQSDDNNDGVISLSEVPAHEASLHKSADTSGNGSIEMTELLELKAREFTAADTNQDGYLDVDEWSKVASVELVLIVDSNGNGFVDREEFIIAVEKSFRRLDKNGDGTLDSRDNVPANALRADRDADGRITLAEWRQVTIAAYDEMPKPVKIPGAPS